MRQFRDAKMRDIGIRRASRRTGDGGHRPAYRLCDERSGYASTDEKDNRHGVSPRFEEDGGRIVSFHRVYYFQFKIFIFRFLKSLISEPVFFCASNEPKSPHAGTAGTR